MPVIMIYTLELTEAQKKIMAKKYTEIMSELTNVPEDRIYVFFNGYPLDGIAAGGTLNSEYPDSALKQFKIKYTEDLMEKESIRVASRMKAKPGMEEMAWEELMSLLIKTRGEEGCLSYDLYKSKMEIESEKSSTSYFILKEKWRDPEAINFHCATDYFLSFMGKSAEMFDGPIEVTKRIGSLRCDDTVDPTGKLIAVYRVKAKPGCEETVKNKLTSLLNRNQEGTACKMYDLYQGFEGIYDPSVYITFQIWDSIESLGDSNKKSAAQIPQLLEDLEESLEAVTFEMISQLVVK